MNSSRISQGKHILYSVIFALYWLPNICLAVAMREMEKRPDGTTIERETIKYFPPQAEMYSRNIIIGIVVFFGGVIALFGIKHIFRALEFGHKDGTAETVIDASAKTLKMKKLTQGAVATAIGAAIMLGALHFLTLRHF